MVQPQRQSPCGVLLSFRRPELTRAAIYRFKASNEALPLIVSVDGLRQSSSRDDAEQREQTLKLARQVSMDFDDVTILEWSEGEGVTDHCTRVLLRVFETYESALLLEEDIEVSSRGFEFLTSEIENARDACLVASYSSHAHFEEYTHARRTAFPQQWGIAINAKLFERFLACKNHKSSNPEVVEFGISSGQFSVRERHMLRRYWRRVFDGALNSLDRCDAILQYALWSEFQLAKVPWNSFANDLGLDDSRSLNPRAVLVPEQPHSAELEGRVCLRCERLMTSTHRINFLKEGLLGVLPYSAPRYLKWTGR